MRAFRTIEIALYLLFLRFRHAVLPPPISNASVWNPPFIMDPGIGQVKDRGVGGGGGGGLGGFNPPPNFSEKIKTY